MYDIHHLNMSINVLLIHSKGASFGCLQVLVVNKFESSTIESIHHLYPFFSPNFTKTYGDLVIIEISILVLEGKKVSRFCNEFHPVSHLLISDIPVYNQYTHSW